MYQIERKRRLWKPWEWYLVLSSYGAAGGTAWTKRGAEKQLLMMQGEWFAE